MSCILVSVYFAWKGMEQDLYCKPNINNTNYTMNVMAFAFYKYNNYTHAITVVVIKQVSIHLHVVLYGIFTTYQLKYGFSGCHS